MTWVMRTWQKWWRQVVNHSISYVWQKRNRQREWWRAQVVVDSVCDDVRNTYTTEVMTCEQVLHDSQKWWCNEILTLVMTDYDSNTHTTVITKWRSLLPCCKNIAFFFQMKASDGITPQVVLSASSGRPTVARATKVLREYPPVHTLLMVLSTLLSYVTRHVPSICITWSAWREELITWVHNAHDFYNSFSAVIVRTWNWIWIALCLLNISLIRLTLQFDFDFVDVHRVKEFSFRPLCHEESEEEVEEISGGLSRVNRDKNVMLTRQKRTAERQKQQKSVWNVDGEIVEEPSVHVR